ncbi:MAG: MGMT family protein [Bdellovibrionaceae bacterium]|nr:MGMT family protein [Pseudobdellovibrionaceae bacterium]
MTEFSKKVMSFILQVPKGRVATYKQIAELAGKHQGARGVAWILNSSSQKHKLPWHRILGSSGKISFPQSSLHFKRQRKLLLQEKIRVADNGSIDLKKFQWNKKAKAPKNLPRMFRSN